MFGRRQHPFAIAAALLALLLRLLLPALHDERAHRAPASPATAMCSCGHYHAELRDHGAPTRAERADQSTATAHVCLACQVQASTPGSVPTPAIVLVLYGACTDLDRLTLPAAEAAARAELPPSRAPPMPA